MFVGEKSEVGLLKGFLEAALLVAGRDMGEEEAPVLLESTASAAFFFHENCRSSVVSSGHPKTKPADATPTVLAATS